MKNNNRGNILIFDVNNSFYSCSPFISIQREMKRALPFVYSNNNWCLARINNNQKKDFHKFELYENNGYSLYGNE